MDSLRKLYCRYLTHSHNTDQNTEMTKATMNTRSIITRCTLAAVILSMSTACSQSYPGLVYPGPDEEIGNNETYDKTPIMLFVNEQNFFSISATRGTGAFDQEDNGGFNEGRRKNTILYVMAFRNGKDQQGPLGAPADLTKTRYAEGKTHDDDNESCLLDGGSYLKGMPMELNAENGGALRIIKEGTGEGDFWTGEEPNYSTTYQDVGYNFFAYYIDDFKPTVSNTHRNSDRIYYDLIVDGSQDILYGAAPPLTMEKLYQSYADLHLSYEDMAKIVNANGYSTFAAHRDVHPAIELQHAMTRFKFEAYPGGDDANNIKITGIKMKSRYKGEMTVAARSTDELGIDYDDEETWLYLKECAGDGTPATPLQEVTVEYDNSMVDTPWNERPHKSVGSSLLLPPSYQYKLVIEYEQCVDTEHNIWKPITTTYTVTAPKSDSDAGTEYAIFQPGCVYTMKIAIFGLSSIKVYASVKGWSEGGEILINPDNAEEF